MLLTEVLLYATGETLASVSTDAEADKVDKLEGDCVRSSLKPSRAARASAQELWSSKEGADHATDLRSVLEALQPVLAALSSVDYTVSEAGDTIVQPSLGTDPDIHHNFRAECVTMLLNWITTAHAATLQYSATREPLASFAAISTMQPACDIVESVALEPGFARSQDRSAVAGGLAGRASSLHTHRLAFPPLTSLPHPKPLLDQVGGALEASEGYTASIALLIGVNTYTVREHVHVAGQRHGCQSRCASL